jgi:hypothetical protein
MHIALPVREHDPHLLQLFRISKSQVMGDGTYSYVMKPIISGYNSWLNHDEHSVHLSKSGDQDIDLSHRNER